MKKTTSLMTLVFILFTSTLIALDDAVYLGGGILYNYNYGYKKLFDKFNYKPVTISTCGHANCMYMVELPLLENHWAGLDLGINYSESDVKINDSILVNIPPSYYNIGIVFSYNYLWEKYLSINPTCKVGFTFPTFSFTNQNSKYLKSINDITNDVNPAETDISGNGYYVYLGCSILFGPTLWKNKKVPAQSIGKDGLSEPVATEDYNDRLGFLLEIGFVASYIDHWQSGGYPINKVAIYAFKGLVIALNWKCW